MFLRRFLPTVLVVPLLSCAIVLARELTRDGDNLEELNNRLGQTPCTLTEEITAHCQSPSRSRRAVRIRDSTATHPAPTECTCNNVFFNLWSACLLLQGNTTLPVFDDFKSDCHDSFTNLTAGFPDKKNVDIPSWAFANVTSSSTFNVNAAISIAKKRRGWTALQIVLPIIVGVGMVGLALFGVLFYRRRSELSQTWPSTIMHCLRLRPRVYKVKRGNRDGPWSIDPAEGTEDYLAVDGDKRHSTKSHARLSSTETISVAALSDHAKSLGLPLKTRMARRLRDLPDQFSFPWRDRPVEVPSKPHGRNFRVDSWDASTSSPSTVSGAHSRNAPTEYGSGAGNSRTHQDAILEEDEENVETSLISPVDRDENDVFLIGHQPGNFTLESGSSNSKPRSVQVIPPTPTASYTGSLIHPTLPPTMLPNRMHIPPTPTLPAPIPPPSPHRILPQPQRPAANLYQSEPIASRPISPSILPTHQPHSPLLHYSSFESIMRSPVHVQHAPPRVTSPRASRPLPMTGEVDRNGLLIRPVARLASPSSIESLYLDTTITHPASGHKRTPSDLRPLMGSPHSDSPPMISPLSLPGLSPQEELTYQHLNSSRSSSRLRQPRSPSPYYRALSPTVLSSPRQSSDDSTENSYLSGGSSHYGTHSRNASETTIIPGRGDPVMLFPGSVRGAGYAPQSPQSPQSPPPTIYYDSSS